VTIEINVRVPYLVGDREFTALRMKYSQGALLSKFLEGLEETVIIIKLSGEIF